MVSRFPPKIATGSTSSIDARIVECNALHDVFESRTLALLEQRSAHSVNYVPICNAAYH